MKVDPVTGLKRCPGCQEHKTLEHFSRHHRRADGHNVYCKPCVTEQRRNDPKDKERNRRYRQSHREQYNARMREYSQRPERKEYMREYMREYYKSRPEKREKNRELVRLRYHRRKADNSTSP